jgi:hypothetical protein
VAPTSNTIAVRVAVQDVQGALQALRQLGAGGEAEFQRLTAGAVRTNTALEAIGAGTQRGSGGLRNFGEIARQAGFQVGDFAVQVQGGTSVLTAFVQQGSQIAGAFGPLGAVIGAVGAVVGALASSFLRAGEAADTATGKFDLFADAARRVTEEGKKAREAFAQQQNETLPVFTGGKLIEQNIDDLEAQIKLINETERLLAEANKRQSLGAGDIRPSARDTFGGEGESQRRIRRQQLEDEAKATKEVAAEAERLAKARASEAESAAKQAKQREQTIRLAEFEAEAAKRLADANEISVEARKELEPIIDAERRTLQASVALQGEEIDRITAANAARAEQEQRQIKTNEQRKKENDLLEEAARLQKKYDDQVAQIQGKIVGDAKRNAEREAELQADILAQPYKDLAGEISGLVSEGINSALTDPENFDFGDVAKSFADAMATAVSGSIGNALTAPLNAVVAEFGKDLAAALKPGGAGLAGFAQQNGTLLAGGAGFVGGSLLAQATGGNSQFGGLGGALGAAGGYAIGGIPGALIGGVGGSLIGGLFGSENNLGNDRSAQTFNSRRGIVYSDSNFSPENRNITSGIANEVQTLADLFGDLGGTVANFNLRLEAGNKSGITVNGKKYSTVAAAIAASIEVLVGNVSNLSATQQTILANTKGGSAQEVAQDLAFGETYDALIFQGREVDLVLQELNKTFVAAGREAAKLGLDVQALADAHAREAQAVVDEFRARQQAASLNIETLARGNGSTIDLQFAQLEVQMQALAREAVELGISLDRVTAAHVAQANALAFQYDQQQRNVAAQLALIAGDESLGTQLFILETQMRELAVAAAAVGIPLEQVTAAHIAAAANLTAEFQAREQAERDAAKAAEEAERERKRAEAERLRAEAEQRRRQARDLTQQLTVLAGGGGLQSDLQALKFQFEDFKEQAKELGVSLGLVNRAYRAQVEALKEQYAAQQAQLRLQLRQVIEGNTLAVQLAEIALQFAEMRKQAEELGVPLRQVAEAEKAAAAAARQRFAAEQQNFRLQLRQTAGEEGLAIQLAFLNAEMEEAKLRAKELGIPIKLVTDAYGKAADALREQQQQQAQSLKLQLRQIAGEESVALSLALLDERMAALRKEAETLGVPLDLVTKAHQAAAAAIIQAQKDLIESTRKQEEELQGQLRDQVRGVQGLFANLIDPLKNALANDNRLSPLAQIQQARSQFNDLARQARGGDVEAIRQLAGSAENLRGLSTRFLGSGEQGAAIAREIEAALRSTVGTLEQQQRETLASLPAVQRETVAEMIREAKKDTADIIAELERVRRELATLRRAA